MRTRLSYLCILLAGSALAGTETQTDWSGGSGTIGPVYWWGNEFWSGYSTDYETTPGSLMLDASSAENDVVSGMQEARSAAVADIDGDGHGDVICCALQCDSIIWLRNEDGSGTSWTTNIVTNYVGGPNSVVAADLDDDGDVDIIAAVMYWNSILWWENTDGTGTSWTEHAIDEDFGSANCVYTADVDGDGDEDVLGACNIDNDIAWWENADGSGTSWVDHTIDGNFLGATCVSAADVNGDGDIDVLGAASQDDDLVCWHNEDGSGTSWTEHCIHDFFNSASSVSAGDIDGDGDMDVVGSASYMSDITWFENEDGSGTSWDGHPVVTDFSYASWAHAANLDGDTDMDILGVSYGDDEVVWWENEDGTGASWQEHILSYNFDEPQFVTAGDLDSEGADDVVAASTELAKVTWWNVSGYQPEGVLVSSILDLEEMSQQQYLDWTCSEPEGTEIAFLGRASDNPNYMGSWSDTLSSPDSLTGVFEEGDYLFQYKAWLYNSDGYATPVLEDVTLSWEPLGAVEEASSPVPGGTALLGPRSNPADGDGLLEFVLENDGVVELAVYDIYGRLRRRISESCEAGRHAVAFDGLESGAYFVRMRCGDFSTSQRFVVIR